MLDIAMWDIFDIHRILKTGSFSVIGGGGGSYAGGHLAKI
jgi:hypothetical protein